MSNHLSNAKYSIVAAFLTDKDKFKYDENKRTIRSQTQLYKILLTPIALWGNGLKSFNLKFIHP